MYTNLVILKRLSSNQRVTDLMPDSPSPVELSKILNPSECHDSVCMGDYNGVTHYGFGNLFEFCIFFYFTAFVLFCLSLASFSLQMTHLTKSCTVPQ